MLRDERCPVTRDFGVAGLESAEGRAYANMGIVSSSAES